MVVEVVAVEEVDVKAFDMVVVETCSLLLYLFSQAYLFRGILDCVKYDCVALL